MIAVLLSLTIYLHQAWGYGSGAPGRQCDRMYPGHGLSAQFGPSPYTIGLSQNTFGCPGETITVTVTGTEPFTGFLCEPRPNPEVYATSGVLSSDASDGVSKQDLCGAGKSLTHINNENKTTISFQWRPTTVDNVYMVCTMVMGYRTFWVKQRSEVLTYVKRDCTKPDQNTADPSSGQGVTAETTAGTTSSGKDASTSGGASTGTGTDGASSNNNNNDTSTNQQQGGNATDAGNQSTSGNGGSEGGSTGAHNQSTPTSNNNNGGSDKGNNLSARFVENIGLIVMCVLCTLRISY